MFVTGEQLLTVESLGQTCGDGSASSAREPVHVQAYDNASPSCSRLSRVVLEEDVICASLK